MTRNLESRLAKLEKEHAPEGRRFYVWKDSEQHRQAEEQLRPGDVIHVIGWLDGAACSVPEEAKHKS